MAPAALKRPQNRPRTPHTHIPEMKRGIMTFIYPMTLSATKATLAARAKALNSTQTILETTTQTLQTTTKLLAETKAALRTSREAHKKTKARLKERSEKPKPAAVENDDTKRGLPTPDAKVEPKAKGKSDKGS